MTTRATSINYAEKLLVAAKEVQDRKGERTLSKTMNYLLALGLAADWEATHPPSVARNPYLGVDPEYLP